jgi:cbb3-type cytochrome oxidase subunit 3
MTPYLQLLVAAGVAIAGTIIALRIDKKEHRDARQGTLDLRNDENDRLKNNRVAMSRTQL